MNATVVAAIIAACVSGLTLICTVVTQIIGFRSTRANTERQIKATEKNTADTLAQQREQLDKTLGEQRFRTLNERFATAAGQLGGEYHPVSGSSHHPAPQAVVLADLATHPWCGGPGRHRADVPAAPRPAAAGRAEASGSSAAGPAPAPEGGRRHGHGRPGHLRLRRADPLCPTWVEEDPRFMFEDLAGGSSLSAPALWGLDLRLIPRSN
jgi:hypothetical protein